jgi:hypothetical protein
MDELQNYVQIGKSFEKLLKDTLLLEYSPPED